MSSINRSSGCSGWDNIVSWYGDKPHICKFFDSMVEGIILSEMTCNEHGNPCDFKIIRVNPAFEKITGLKNKEIAGKMAKEALGEIEDYWLNCFYKVALNGESITYEGYLKSLGIYVRANICSSEYGKFIVLFNDVTNIKRADSLSKKYELLLDNAKDIILFISENGKILEVNKAAIEAYGYTYEELVSFNIEKIRASQFNCVSNNESKDIYDKGIIFETMHQRKDGTVFPVEVSSTGTEFNGEYIVLSIVRDITERKALEERLHKLAYYDPVTELPNKKLFSEYIIAALDEVKANNKMLAVLFIDLDRYKKVNDTMGHLIGDRLLKESAERFKTFVDDNVFAARVGGDEFIFVQKGISNAQEAAELAYKILNEIKAPFNFDGYEVHITTSIGISLYPEHGDDVLTLMKNADTSMYRVKNKGRNNYEFYTPGMNKESYEDLIIESNLHHALENNELVLYYQPKINVVSGEIIGMEALVRWQNPKLGLIAPVKFISLAEENGLIVPIGEWVLYTACKQSKEWQRAGMEPLTVAVNLSVRQFEQGNLAETVGRILKETGLEPKYLELEITETMAIKNMDTINDTLKKLRDMGINIALDDFGTGYSSLKYLRNIPVDILKIDRAFVNDITNNTNYIAIIDAIINIANKLNLRLIAEGVETIEQQDFLRQKQCYEMQGYLFGKPMSKEDFEKIMIKQNNTTT